MEDGCGIYRTAADHAGDLRQARRAEAALPARAGRRPHPRSGTPSGCSAIELGLPARRGAGDGPFGAATAASRAARTSGWTASSSATTSTSSSTRWRTTRGDGRAAHRLRPGEDHHARSPARAPTAPPAKRPTARPRRPRMPDNANESRSRCLRYRPEQEDEPRLAELLRAVHRRHVGAAGPAVHQGRPRRHAELPLVVPHGDLRQLRHDGQRQAQAVLPDLPARLLPGPVRVEALAHFPIERDLVVERRATSSTSSRASSPTSSPRSRARWPRANTCRRRSSSSSSSSSARASTACCATRPARSTA